MLSEMEIIKIIINDVVLCERKLGKLYRINNVFLWLCKKIMKNSFIFLLIFSLT